MVQLVFVSVGAVDNVDGGGWFHVLGGSCVWSGVVTC